MTGEQRAASGVCVPIEDVDGVRGALCVHASTPRTFTPNEVGFLQSVANICGLSLHLAHMQSQLDSRE